MSYSYSWHCGKDHPQNHTNEHEQLVRDIWWYFVDRFLTIRAGLVTFETGEVRKLRKGAKTQRCEVLKMFLHNYSELLRRCVLAALR